MVSPQEETRRYRIGRVAELVAGLKKKGITDSEVAVKEIVKMWGVTRRTALEYIYAVS